MNLQRHHRAKMLHGMDAMLMYTINSICYRYLLSLCSYMTFSSNVLSLSIWVLSVNIQSLVLHSSLLFQCHKSCYNFKDDRLRRRIVKIHSYRSKFMSLEKNLKVLLSIDSLWFPFVPMDIFFCLKGPRSIKSINVFSALRGTLL
jgi:hypothetical protein